MGKSYYAQTIGGLKHSIRQRRNLEHSLATLRDELETSQSRLVDLTNAQKLLSTVSDDNTDTVLDFITGVVNKALAEIFPNEVCKIHLKKKLYAQSKPHIIVELVNESGRNIDMTLQTGTGVGQIVSVLFSICLVEIRKGRRLILLDEKLNGLHKGAKKVLSEILKIFADGGFQFVFVEYGLNDLGKIYNIEKNGNCSKAYPLSADDTYDDNEIFIFTKDVDLNVLDKEYKEDSDEEVTEKEIG